MTTLAAGSELDRLVERMCEPERYAKHAEMRQELRNIRYKGEITPDMRAFEATPYSTDPGIAFTLLLKVCKEREWWYEISSDYIVIDGPQWSPRGPRSRLVCIRHTDEATAICLALVEACEKTTGVQS